VKGRCLLWCAVLFPVLICEYVTGQDPVSVLEWQADAKYLGKKAKSAIRHGRIDVGRTYLKASLEILGQYRPILTNPPCHEVSEDDLAYGRHQFSQFLKDRPCVSELASRAGFFKLKQWAIRQFAGESSGGRVRWSKRTSHLGFYNVGACDPTPGSDGSVKTIFVSDFLWTRDHNTGAAIVTPIPAEHVWSVLVYELQNILNRRRYVQLRRDAMAGRISSDEYVHGIVELELPAVALTLKHYADVYLPFVKMSGTKTIPELWYLDELGWARDAKHVLLIHERKTDRWPWRMERHYRVLRSRGAVPSGDNCKRPF